MCYVSPRWLFKQMKLKTYLVAQVEVSWFTLIALKLLTFSVPLVVSCKVFTDFSGDSVITWYLYFNHTVYFSVWHCQELHCGLWQGSHFQQNSSWAKSVLQCSQLTRSKYSKIRVVVWYCFIDWSSFNLLILNKKPRPHFFFQTYCQHFTSKISQSL